MMRNMKLVAKAKPEPASVRSFQCPDRLWEQAADLARRADVPVSEVVRVALATFVEEGAEGAS